MRRLVAQKAVLAERPALMTPGWAGITFLTALCLASPSAGLSDLPSFGATVDLVYVTVSVRDPQGKVVRGLGLDDFVLFEDGHRRTISVVANAAEPGEERNLALDLGLLFDTSESMAKEIRRAQESALRFLEAIPRARDLLVIFFDSDIRISRYSNEQQQGLISRILETEGAGHTALYDAIIAYVSRVDDVPGRKALVLFTDGEDTTSDASVKDMLDVVRSAGVTVYPVSFAEGSFGSTPTRLAVARALLSHLATASGGEIFSPLSSRDLPAVYERILDDLGGQYIVGFAPGASTKKGWRKLKVELTGKRKDHKLRYREGFTPQPATVSESPPGR